MNIAICGLGVVGTCHKNWFLAHGHNVFCYDPPKGLLDYMGSSDLVFICVPTPNGPRHLDAINSCVSNLAGQKTVVIRSTVTPGTTANLQRQYPQHRFLYIPEFLQEDTAQHDFENQPLYVLGTVEPKSVSNLQQQIPDCEGVISGILPHAPVVHTNSTTAELYKLARNAFLATKNAFFNQLWEYSQGLASYDDLALAAALDPLIGPTHTLTPHKGKRGYSGKCLPKDAQILLDSDIYENLHILRYAQYYNQELLRGQGLLNNDHKDVTRPA